MFPPGKLENSVVRTRSGRADDSVIVSMDIGVRHLRWLAHRVSTIERRNRSKASHLVTRVYPALRARLHDALGARLAHARVLDFGCGDDHALVTLLRPDVGSITGVDIVPPRTLGLRRRISFEGGFTPKGIGKGLLGWVEASRRISYMNELARRAPGASSVIHYDGSRLPFDDASFDIVISNAVLQELPPPLEGFAREIRRVLKPGGVIDLEWHSFTSLDGHYVGIEATSARPWFHLLDNAGDDKLNRHTPAEMAEAFAPYFEGLDNLPHDRKLRIRGRDPAYEPEGVELLSPDLLEQLEQLGFTYDALTTRGYFLVGRAR